MKIISLAVLIFLCVKGKDVAMDQMKRIANLSGQGVVQQEVGEISRHIYLDFIVSEKGLPLESDEWWTGYIRDEVQPKAAGRDAARDMWGTRYQVRILDRLSDDGGGAGYSVRSAGEDKKFDTPDDVVAVGKCGG